MSAEAHIICIDDHKIIASGCQAEFTKADRPWTVHWYQNVAAVAYPQSEHVVALLDLRLRDRSRASANVAELQAHDVPVIIYTSGDDRFRLREAAEAGVFDIVMKSSEDDAARLITTIEAALEGKPSVSIELAALMDEDEDFTKRLPKTHLQVLRLYASGLEAKQVASVLTLSENTVTKYVDQAKKAYREVGRLQNDSRAGLFIETMRDGLNPSFYDDRPS